jgi:hypothetical protein
MLLYWINLDGPQTVIVPLGLKRPLSTLVVAIVLSLRALLLLLASIGIWSVVMATHRNFSPGETTLAIVCAVGVVLRTVELGILGVLDSLSWGGLLEARYVTPVFPLLLILGLFGLAGIASAWSSSRLQRGNSNSPRRVNGEM